MSQMSFTKIIQGPLVAVLAGILLNLAFSSVDSMKLKNEQLVRLPVWKIDQLPEGAELLEEATAGGEKRYQTMKVTNGPVAFKSDDGLYYLESPKDLEVEQKGLAKLPKDSLALDDPTSHGQPRFQLREVKKGPVYFEAEDGSCLLYTSDAADE